MKVKRYDGKDARVVLTGMIVNTVVANRIAPHWTKGGLFATEEENRFGTWAIEHVRKYGEAIGRAIELKFSEWEEKADPEDARFGHTFLGYLSQEYERSDPLPVEYTIDAAGRVFNRVLLKRVMGDVEDDLDNNEVDAALASVAGVNKIELGVGAIIKPGENFEAWCDAFDDDQAEALIVYDGALGKFIGNEFARDAFVAFMAASKRGKSWWLLDAAYRATKQQRRTALFEVGDMSLNQTMRRMGRRATRLPRRPMSVRKPIAYTDPELPECEEVNYEQGCSARRSYKVWRQLQRGRDLLRLSVHPNSSITAAGIASILDQWARDGWVADVVVIDYADILAAPQGARDLREATNENWKRLRRLSQELHCCVVTATQADAESYDALTLRRRNFSDDRRKHDHVTAMLGINATEQERERGITRLNWLDRRDAEFNEQNVVHVAGQLDIGCPVLFSFLS